MDAVFSNPDEYLQAFGITLGLFVVSGLACPRMSWTSDRSAPRFNSRLARSWRNECGVAREPTAA